MSELAQARRRVRADQRALYRQLGLETVDDTPVVGVLETAETGVREILVEEIPVEVRIREILDVLEAKSYVSFSELFPKGSKKMTLVITFLALLELIRLKQARVTQPAHFGDIFINRVVDNELQLSASPTA
jgi:segregation and condensation protein A